MTETTAMSEAYLGEIAAREQAATRGPWRGDRLDGTVKYELLGKNDELILAVDHKNGTWGFLGDNGRADESFIMHARTDIPDLLAEVQRLREENIDLQDEIAELQEEVNFLLQDCEEEECCGA